MCFLDQLRYRCSHVENLTISLCREAYGAAPIRPSVYDVCYYTLPRVRETDPDDCPSCTEQADQRRAIEEHWGCPCNDFRYETSDTASSWARDSSGDDGSDETDDYSSDEDYDGDGEYEEDSSDDSGDDEDEVENDFVSYVSEDTVRPHHPDATEPADPVGGMGPATLETTTPRILTLWDTAGETQDAYDLRRTIDHDYDSNQSDSCTDEDMAHGALREAVEQVIRILVQEYREEIN